MGLSYRAGSLFPSVFCWNVGKRVGGKTVDKSDLGDASFCRDGAEGCGHGWSAARRKRGGGGWGMRKAEGGRRKAE